MLVSVTQGAKELGVSEEHIRRLIRAQKLPVYELGPKATRLDVQEIRTLLKREAAGRLDNDSSDKGELSGKEQ